ncbi:sigma-70 family RNA polymerase sigma factor [Pelagicoccus sp. SDUM812005]|uniref:sigma-70 family RNA polymerase sigma factor n=1 Tax=Pelagicoccus sp. SDUM812005 TaxID=3041257 RepID=UPI00280E6BB5|nr:sigma-70 family RNA polymerase sigma factor [Pelagicoccus sp. SDUM812005]MDQ8179593.1 sigma-70 family RNA polymerase sigma factor [Pelagicoccus sp. SDUM812005]
MSIQALADLSTNSPLGSQASNLKIFNEDEASNVTTVNFRAAAPEKKEKAELPERNSIKTYLQEIGKIPLLTPAQEITLARRIQAGEKEARDLMIKSNLRLVVKIAHDYKDFGLPVLDLISEGNIGLVKAVERFDPDKGGKLSTYAAWWIKQSIKRALANQSKTIRLPVHLVDKISRMRKMAMALTEEFGREPTDQELADELEMPVNKVSHLKSVSVRPTSLNAPVGEDGNSTEFGEIVGDDNAPTPYENLHEKSLRGDLHEMITGLDEREAEIIRLRFGLNGDTPLTLEEVGQLFNITRERVRQLQNIALSKMRKIMAGKERQHTAEEIEMENRERKRMEVFREFYEATAAKA